MRDVFGWPWRLMRRIAGGVGSMAGGVWTIRRLSVARVEILGALCGASVNYGGVRGSGVGALQGVELAGYLSGLNQPATWLALAKYMGDDDSLIRLRGYVRTWVNGVSMREGWFGGDDDRVRRLMADLPVTEVLSPMVCKRCSGVGFVTHKVCTKCGGSGHVLMSDRSVASQLDLHPEAFRRRWRDRYGRVLSMVQALDADISRAVSRQVCADMAIGF